MNDKRFFEIFKVTERRRRRKTNKWKSGSSRRVSNVNIARGKKKENFIYSTRTVERNMNNVEKRIYKGNGEEEIRFNVEWREREREKRGSCLGESVRL